MIAVDTNILVYAHRRDSAWHAPAAQVVRGLAEGLAAWLVPWPCLHEFLAIVTHPRIYSPPSEPAAAVQQVEFWMQSPSLAVDGEAAGHWTTLRDLMLQAKLAGPAVHDARVAAICISHGVDLLWTADRDFSRFRSLKTANPLIVV